MPNGKCPNCRVRFVWSGLPRVRHATCPRCDERLEPTTHLLRWPEVEARPGSILNPNRRRRNA